MNPERRLAALEAFACTKPREFDAFLQTWNEANPEPQPEPIIDEEAPKTTRRRKATIEPATDSTTDPVSTES